MTRRRRAATGTLTATTTRLVGCPTGLLRDGEVFGDIEEVAEKTLRDDVVGEVAGGGPEYPVSDGFAIGRTIVGAGSIIWIVIKNAEHRKGARPSTEEKHQKAETTRKRDAGGENGDKRRPDDRPKRAGGGRSPGSKRSKPSKPPMIHKPKP